MNDDKIISEARARIMWGEPSLAVRDFLSSTGVPDSVAVAKLAEFEQERNLELRMIGVRNVLIGVVLAGAGGITLWIALPYAFNRIIIYGLALVLMAGCYGLWKLVKGVIYLVCPQSEHKSIPDIE